MKDKEFKKQCKDKGFYSLSYFLKIFDAYSRASKGDLLGEEVFDGDGDLERSHKKMVWNALLDKDSKPDCK